MKLRGRPRKYANNAAKQKQYRWRKQAPIRQELRRRILRTVRRLERMTLAAQLEQMTTRKLTWLAKITSRKLTRR